MLEVFYKSYKILPVSERRKFVHLQILVIIVALIEQELGKVGAILARDPGYQCFFHFLRLSLF